MCKFFLCLGIISTILWLGYKITNSLLMTFVWLFIRVPCAFCIGMLGLILCITVVLVPIGSECIKIAIRLVEPDC